MKRLLLLLAACATTCAAPSKGLLLQSLNFPQQSDSSYVVVRPTESMGLKAFTLCMKILSESRKTMSLFSYATETDANQLLLEMGGDRLRLHLAKELVEFRVPMASVGWTPICVTWDSQTGRAMAWANGIRTVSKIISKGKDVVASGVVILGQDQDTVSGAFNKDQSYVGELTDVNLWNYVLRGTEMVTSSRRYRGNVIDWTRMQYEITGNVFVHGPDD